MANEAKIDIDIYRGPISTEKLKGAIAVCQPKAEYTILESLTITSFPVPAKAQIDPAISPKGRLFAPSFEFRWETTDQGAISVLATEDSSGWPADLLNLLELDTSVANAYQNGYCDDQNNYCVFLRPENDASLGRTLSYEKLDDNGRKNGKNAILEIKRYFSNTGRLLFFLYRKMRWE